MALWIILGLFLLVILLLAWLVFVPITLIADTGANRYIIFQPITFSAIIVPWSESMIRLKILGISFKPTLAEERPTMKKKTKTKKDSASTQKPFSSWLTLLKRSLKCLTIKKINIAIDSGDVVMNAKMIPSAYFLSTLNNVQVNINFQGDVYGYLEAKIRLHVLVSAFVKHLFNF